MILIRVCVYICLYVCFYISCYTGIPIKFAWQWEERQYNDSFSHVKQKVEICSPTTVEQLHKIRRAWSPPLSSSASASTLWSKMPLQFWALRPGNCIESRSKKKEKSKTGIPSSSKDSFLEVPDDISLFTLHCK